MKSRVLPLVSLALALAGCGGSKGSSSPAPSAIAPRIAIAWGARTRDVSGPSSALSATVVLEGADADGTDFAFDVARPGGTAASTQTYVAPAAARRKATLLTVRFFAGTGATGDVVGVASASVKVAASGDLTRSDGSPLGTLGTVGAVVSANVPTGQSVDVGTSKDLAIEALNAQGYPLAVSPGSFSLAVTQGADLLRADGGPGVTALGEGTVTVVATVDGKASAPVLVTVNGPGVATRSINVLTNALRYDATRDRIWASLAPGGTGGDAVVDIDAATGTLGTPIAVGAGPNALALSDDGTTLYVGLDGDHTIRRVDLSARTAGLEFPVADDGYGIPFVAQDLAVQPGNDAVVAVTTGVDALNGRDGPAIYEDGVRRPNYLGSYDGSQIVWTSPTRLVAYDGNTTGANLYDVKVDADGASLVRKTDQGLGYFGRDLVRAGGRIYASDGSVIDENTLTKLGQFPHEDFSVYQTSFAGPVVDLAANRAYFVQLDSRGARLRAYRPDTFASVANRPLSNVAANAGLFNAGDVSLVRWGAHGLAFRTTDYVYFVDDVSGL